MKLRFKKRIISGIVTFGMILSIFPISVLAVSDDMLNSDQDLSTQQSISSTDVQPLGGTPLSGTCGPNLTWTLDDEGTLAISGTGEMEDYTAQGYVPWYFSGHVIIGDIKKVVIGSGVTSIGDLAFAGCDNLKYVEIPETVTDIGRSAFSGCSSLQEVDLPSNLTVISAYAFNRCEVLKELIVPQNVSVIGVGAFNGCSSLEKIIIPASAIEIGEHSNPSTSIFSGCILLKSAGPIGSNSNIEFGWTNEIPDRAFNGSELTQVTIPDTIQKIGANAFQNCDNIEQVIIPDGVIEIGAGAFRECDNLKYIQIPNSIEKMSLFTFYDSNELKTVGPIGSGCNIEIGWVEKIPSYAFSDCNKISSIIIPEGITSIGQDAFSDCSALEYVRIPESVVYMGERSSAYTEVFPDCDKLISAGPIGSNSNIEYGWKTEIPEDAFADCDSLISVDILSGITTIGNSAFYSCDGLTSVDIPESVNTIENSAFSSCGKLNNVTIGGGVTTMEADIFRDCNNLSSISIKNGVSTIGSGMFSGCSSLTSVNIPSSVTSIGRSAFSDCSGLISVTIPESIDTIDWYTFNNCTNLRSAVIPDSVTSIKGDAFSGCTNLTDIYYSGSETDWSGISIANSNEYLINANIHYNSTGLDDPGTGSGISYVAGILKNYDPQTQEIFFEYYDGITEVYEYKVTDQTEVENWNTLIGNPVLVSYIPGEYGTGTLSRYVIKVQPAETKVGIVNAVTDSTITLNGEVFNQNLGDFFGLDYYVGQTVVCYLDDGAVVALNALEKKTGILNAGSNTSVTIDGVKYVAIFDGIPPYLSAPELWFEQEVEYYSYNNGANQIIYKVALKPYSSIFTGKLIKWEGTTVTFEDGTIRQTTQDVVFDATLIGKWVDCTIGTTADGGNVITSIVLAKPTYRTEVKKMIAWNDGNPQFSDGTTMGVFLVGDQYDPVMIGRWVELTIADDRNTGTKITGISLAVPSSKSEFQLINPIDIYLKGNQYSFDGQNYEDSSKFEIEFKIFIQNIVENVSDINLSEMKKDTSMNLTVEDIQITEPDGFNFGWTGSGAVGDGKGLAVPAGEIREITGFIRPGMLYFVDEKEVTETIACKIILSNGDVFEKELLFTIHNLDYKEPSTGGDGDNNNIEDLSKDAAEALEALEIDKIITLTDTQLLMNDFGLSAESIDALRKNILTNLVMCTIPEESLSEVVSEKLFDKFFSQYKLQVSVSKQKVTLRYIFDTPKYGNLTVAIDCNLSRVNLDETEFAMYGFLNYTVLNQEKNPPANFPSYKKQGDFGMIMQYDIKNFADAAYKLAEEEIKENLYDESVGKTVSKLADIVFSETTKNIFEYLDISPEEKFWELITWPTKSTRAACPIDVYVYDSNGNLCGAIENNVITKQDPDNFELRVEGDVKYVLGLEDNYRIEYVATDNGTMDVEITEEIGYNRPFRKISFNDISLTDDGTYSQNTPLGVLSDISEYTIVSSVDGNNISTILADSEELLLDLGSDKTEEPDGGVTGDGGESDNDSDNNGGDTNSDTSSDNDTHSGGGVNVSTTYAITVKGTNNGTITCSPSRAVHGNNVLITVKSDEGYELSDLLVTDKNGNSINLVKKNETQYTFTMPASKVTVSATFTKIVVKPEPVVLPFDDILQSAWYYGAVEYVYSNDMMQGTSATTFSPKVEMSRGMIATVLYRLANTPTQTGSISFGDVGENEWYTDAIQWASENGIMKGYGNNQFGPMDNVTREQLALIFYNYTASKGISVTTTGDLSAFHDAQHTSDWAEEAISWAVGVGLLSGKGNGILDPTGTATHAEVAQILMNYCTKVM